MVVRRLDLEERVDLDTALGSDGQGPQGFSFGFLAFCLIFYLSFLFWELDQQRIWRNLARAELAGVCKKHKLRN